MSRTAWAWVRRLGGAAILVALVWRLGTGPFLHGIEKISGPSVVAAVGITAVTTVSSAWRWSVVARGLGVTVPLRVAIPAYYRSQLVNVALPGGVLGDVDRGVRQGKQAGDIGRGLRAVAWERVAGQVVQAVLALIVLIWLASPVRASMPVVVLAVVVIGFVAGLVLRGRPNLGLSRRARALRAAHADIRDGLLARRAWPAVTLASVIAVTGYTSIFLVAAWTTGTTVSVARLLPLAMLVLLAMAVPLNVGGWGPREGVGYWVFSAAGIGAAQGVAAATVYGVLVVIGLLPGLVIFVADYLATFLASSKPPVAQVVTARMESSARA